MSEGIVIKYDKKKHTGTVRCHKTARDFLFKVKASLGITVGDIINFEPDYSYRKPIATDISIVSDSIHKEEEKLMKNFKPPKVKPYDKVFGIGHGKTGTSTLGTACQILGFNHQTMENDMICEIHRGEWDRVWEVVDAHDSFDDNPWMFIYKELDEHYPNSKFILMTRDIDDLYTSNVYQAVRAIREDRKFRVNGSLFNHYGYRYITEHEEEYKEIFRKHEIEVKEYFKDRPDDLLVVNWWEGDGWKKLCTFLGKEYPNQPFPYRKMGYPYPNYDKLVAMAKADPVKFYGERLANMERYTPTTHVRY